MKIRKILATFSVAAIMMASLSAMNTGAESWNVHYTPGAPTSDTVTLCTIPFTSTKDITYIYESCNSYSSSQNNSGRKGYVRYWGYTSDASGRSRGLRFSDYEHRSTQSNHKVTFTSKHPKYQTLLVKYELTTYGLNCRASGNVRL